VKQMMQNIATKAGIVGGAVSTLLLTAFVLAGPASAQTVDPVSTAFDTMQAKIGTYGGAIVALVVASAVLFLGIKYLRKGTSKA